MKNTRMNALVVGALVAALVLSSAVLGQEPPPLPLLGVEGYSGVFATYTAYMANPPLPGAEMGRPNQEGIYVHLGNGRQMYAAAFSMMLNDRFEVGFALDNFDMGDLPQAINAATDIMITDSAVNLYNINARYMIAKESAKSPAVTFGVHYKTNPNIADINRELSGTLTNIGIKDDKGVDFTLYATKMFKAAKPTMVSVGLRSSKAAHLGLLGFTGDRKLTLEGNICVMPANKFVVSAEYRTKSSDYQPIPGLIAAEDDWWTLCAAYIPNNNFTIGAGYGHFGEVLNHTANSSWGIKAKYEF